MEQCDFQIKSRLRAAHLCEPLCPYERPTGWSREALFLFTMCVTAHEEKGGAKEFYVDPGKFANAVDVFDIPGEERREALGVMTWLAHKLSSGAVEEDPEPEEE